MAQATSSPQQQILNHAVGIWPTQLPRDDICEDTSVGIKKTDVPMPLKYGDWEEFVHPLGGTYYFHRDKRTYTSVNLRRYEDLQNIDHFVDALRAAAQEDAWILVVHPTMFRGEEKFQYYYVVPDQHIIAWVEELNSYLLFRDCVQPSQWEHKRLELEAQYWKHFEFFPHQSSMDVAVVRSVRREVICYLGEAITLSQSTAGSIFWTLEQMNQIINHLARIEDLAENELIHETSIVFCCRILYILRALLSRKPGLVERIYISGHHQYLHCHNQPEARLIRNHAAKEKRRNCRLLFFMGNTAATIFCMPVTIESVKRTSVDGVVNGVEVRNFVENLNSQTKGQITLAGFAMALDIAILAVPGLGTTVTAQTLCSCSLLLGVGCIFTGTMVQHFGERMKSIDFAIYYLQKRTAMLVIITSIPTSFCVLSVTDSIFGFFAGVASDFKPSTSLMIACFATLGVVVGSLLVLVVASYGPGLARIRPQ
ncbi:hypothetical protein CY34DRAFT_17569 [Suillus luteus UH-Slu-Lm8-n1]|uniref:Uncharacterized protein n=1 Tax=Suillus luteus UH-Slu-Lm8-n1 TaxID=930992 RepID=A0A0D0AK51_9AGAM|nr:hypothetical protein CY34DRAFT_17569 [Suillus luteus UH-Slu-Lm8-n1]